MSQSPRLLVGSIEHPRGPMTRPWRTTPPRPRTLAISSPSRAVWSTVAQLSPAPDLRNTTVLRQKEKHYTMGDAPYLKNKVW